jgi:hypothetical protein
MNSSDTNSNKKPSGNGNFRKDFPKTGQRVFQTRSDARPQAPRPVDNSNVTGV